MWFRLVRKRSYWWVRLRSIRDCFSLVLEVGFVRLWRFSGNSSNRGYSLVNVRHSGFDITVIRRLLVYARSLPGYRYSWFLVAIHLAFEMHNVKWGVSNATKSVTWVYSTPKLSRNSIMDVGLTFPIKIAVPVTRKCRDPFSESFLRIEKNSNGCFEPTWVVRVQPVTGVW